MLWVIIMIKKHKNILLIILFVLVLGVSINVFAANSAVDCDGVFDSQFLTDIDKYVYTPIKWATPILLLLLTSVDFAKIVISGKKEDMDKAKNNFLKRTVAGLIIFLAPFIVELIVDLIQQNSIKACLNRF